MEPVTLKGVTGNIWKNFVEGICDTLGISPNEQVVIIFFVSIFLAILPFSIPHIHKFLFRNMSAYRSVFDSRESISGEWTETIEKNGRIYKTEVVIYFDKKRDGYLLRGISHDQVGERHAEFTSYLITELLNEQYVEVLYSGTYNKTGRICKGYSYFSFDDSKLSGAGHIVDFELDEKEKLRQTLRLSFSLKRDSRVAKLNFGGRARFRKIG